MQRIEPVLYLLALLVLVFTACLFISERFYPNDGQIFQVVSNLLSGFGGALLMRVKPANKTEEHTPAAEQDDKPKPPEPGALT